MTGEWGIRAGELRMTGGTAVKRAFNAGLLCSIADCDRPMRRNQMCTTHSQRAKSGFDLYAPIHPPKTRRPGGMDAAALLDWIRANSEEIPAPKHFDPCLVWLGKVNRFGYGMVSHEGKLRQVHRFVWVAINGPIPDGLVLDHEACDNRPCWQPTHLVPKTQAENILRGDGRAAKNARKTHCKYGHPFSGENLLVVQRQDGKTERKCIECKRQRGRKSLEGVGQ